MKDINQTPGYGSYPSNFYEYNGLLYFLANDGINGKRIWVTDGSMFNIVLDLYQTDYSYDNTKFIEFNDWLYFTLEPEDSPFDSEFLFRTDGTTENTFEVIALDSISMWNPRKFFLWSDRLYFVAELEYTANRQLWYTDGTIEGTNQLFPDSIMVWHATGSSNQYFLFNNELFFSGQFENEIGVELYKIVDPTAITIDDVDFVSNKFVVYPNPAGDVITINLKDKTSKGFLNIYDINGRKVLKRDFSSELVNIDISNFNEGVYFVVVTGINKNLTAKFIKQ